MIIMSWSAFPLLSTLNNNQLLQSSPTLLSASSSFTPLLLVLGSFWANPPRSWNTLISNAEPLSQRLSLSTDLTPSGHDGVKKVWRRYRSKGFSSSPAFHQIDNRTSCTWGSWAEWVSQLCPLWTLPEGWSSHSPENTWSQVSPGGNVTKQAH